MTRRYDPVDYYRQRLEERTWGPFGPLGDFQAIYVPLGDSGAGSLTPQSKFSYREATAVPVRTRAAAELAFALACRDLGLEGGSLSFFELASPWERGPIVLADERRLVGWSSSAGGQREVWVDGTLDPAAAAFTTVHECRHIEQWATFGPCRTEKTRAARELDAEAYAEDFVARYGVDVIATRGPEPQATESASSWHLPTFLLRGSRGVGGLNLDPGPLTLREPWPSTIGA